MKRGEISEIFRRVNKLASVTKHIMGINTATDLPHFSNTGCCLEMDEYIQSSAYVFIRIK